MKTNWTDDGKLGMELFKRQVGELEKARTIGLMLTECRKPEGELLTDAVDAILRKFSATAEAEPGE